jgi:DMSO/TMAO reductase YedYZ molybdopterin-dependent catalytic subunit
MQVFKRHKKIVLIAILLVVILIVSAFIVQNAVKPSTTLTPSPTPTAPTSTETTSPTPTNLYTPTPTPSSQIVTPPPGATPYLYPGEATQYQGQNLTPISLFIENAINGTQHINQTTYHLTITGLVNNTLELTYDDTVNNFQIHQQLVQITCVEGWAANILWQGVLVNDLLQKAGANPNATTIIFYASDGYSTALPLDYIVQNNLILAYKMNNVTLTAETGWPFMLVAQNQYGYKWIKWITEIDVSDNSSYLGYWESRGYPNNATLLIPNNATLLSPNNVTLPSSNNGTLPGNVSIAEVAVVFVAGTVIAAAIYATLVKTNFKKPKFRNQT